MSSLFKSSMDLELQGFNTVHLSNLEYFISFDDSYEIANLTIIIKQPLLNSSKGMFNQSKLLKFGKHWKLVLRNYTVAFRFAVNFSAPAGPRAQISESKNNFKLKSATIAKVIILKI